MKYRLERVLDRRARKHFVQVPQHVFGSRPTFVPAIVSEEVKRIEPEKNPFFAHAESALWILHGPNGPAGRISATVDRLLIEWTGEQLGVFGHVLAPDADGAQMLLAAAREFLAERGVERMRGPIELSTNYTCGLQVSGFDLIPLIEMNQHPESLGPILERAGLEPVKDLLAFHINPLTATSEQFERIIERSSAHYPVSIRSIDLKQWDRELDILHGIYTSAWEKNFGFVPMTRDEFFASAEGFRQIVVPDLVYIAEHDGKGVGFGLVVPDANDGARACRGRLFPFGFLKFLYAMRKTRRGRLMAFGIAAEARQKGVDARLIWEATVRTRARNYNLVELSWVLEDNVPITRPILKIGGYEAVRYRLFEQDVSADRVNGS